MSGVNNNVNQVGVNNTPGADNNNTQVGTPDPNAVNALNQQLSTPDASATAPVTNSPTNNVTSANSADMKTFLDQVNQFCVQQGIMMTPDPTDN
jgi:hypothetical protein